MDVAINVAELQRRKCFNQSLINFNLLLFRLVPIVFSQDPKSRGSGRDCWDLEIHIRIVIL